MRLNLQSDLQFKNWDINELLTRGIKRSKRFPNWHMQAEKRAISLGDQVSRDRNISDESIRQFMPTWVRQTYQTGDLCAVDSPSSPAERVSCVFSSHLAMLEMLQVLLIKRAALLGWSNHLVVHYERPRFDCCSPEECCAEWRMREAALFLSRQKKPLPSWRHLASAASLRSDLDADYRHGEAQLLAYFAECRSMWGLLCRACSQSTWFDSLQTERVDWLRIRSDTLASQSRCPNWH